ncbi:MAG: carbonic anhydrase [Pseudolabrys sp.]|nr:carbonic anhydrase [Pseudolabrys sp.]
MHRRNALKALTGLALCPVCASAGFAADAPHWSYEGAEGPSHWGDLDAASKVCAVGSQQSPIDIRDPVRAQLPPIGFTWSKPADTVINNGHTIQANFTDGNSITLGKDSYKLLQFHFHRPSEHTIDGKNFPMEVHFVHQHASGGLAVVGVLMATGNANPVFKKVVSTMPAAAGQSIKADAAINPNGMLPANRAYYRYAGSLTTPPCAETVQWLLLTTPIQVAEADVAAFAKLYAMNARPVQKANRRDVLRSG